MRTMAQSLTALPPYMAHDVMDEYLKFRFLEHLAIAAVLARHLAASAVLPDENISLKVQQLDTKLSKLMIKVDSIESKVNLKHQVRFNEVSWLQSPKSPTPKNGGRGGELRTPLPPTSSFLSSSLSTPYGQPPAVIEGKL